MLLLRRVLLTMPIDLLEPGCLPFLVHQSQVSVVFALFKAVNMLTNLVVVAILASHASAFPFVAPHVELDPETMAKGTRLNERTPGDVASCPYNPNHVPAAPITAQYPLVGFCRPCHCDLHLTLAIYRYCGSVDGLPGLQLCANNKVPANGPWCLNRQAMKVLILAQVIRPMSGWLQAPTTFVDLVRVSIQVEQSVRSNIICTKLTECHSCQPQFPRSRWDNYLC